MNGIELLKAFAENLADSPLLCQSFKHSGHV